MELIDKNTVVEKIEELINDEFQCDSYDESTGFQKALDSIKSFIDTIEVKNVDLDETARKWEDKVYLEKGWQDSYGIPHVPFHEIGNAFIEGAKFVLKVQKGE